MPPLQLVETSVIVAALGFTDIKSHPDDQTTQPTKPLQ